LIGDRGSVAGLDVLHRVPGNAAAGAGDHLIGAGGAIPAPVAIHGVVATAHRDNTAATDPLQPLAESSDESRRAGGRLVATGGEGVEVHPPQATPLRQLDRKSTRLNSSHGSI